MTLAAPLMGSVHVQMRRIYGYTRNAELTYFGLLLSKLHCHLVAAVSNYHCYCKLIATVAPSVLAVSSRDLSSQPGRSGRLGSGDREVSDALLDESHSVSL